MKKVILIFSIFLLTAACSDSNNNTGASNTNTVSNGENKPELLSVESSPAELYLGNRIYRKEGAFSILSHEDVTAVASICFGQNPQGAIPEKQMLSAEEFSAIAFEKQSCTSQLIQLKAGTNKYSAVFNMFEAINGLEGEQVLSGDTTVYAFIDGDYDTYILLGNEKLEEMKPYIALQRGVHDSTFLPSNNNLVSWSIKDNKEPEFIYATALFNVTISGKNIDSISIDADNGNNGFVDVYNKDNEKIGTLNYVLENTTLEPATVNANINTTDDKTLTTVNFKKFSTTNEDTFPEVTAVINIKFNYKDIKNFLQKIDSNGTMISSSLHPAYINIPFTASSKLNGVNISRSETCVINFADIINDARDMYSSIYTAEYGVMNTNNHMAKAGFFKSSESIDPVINKLTYEANKTINSGSEHFQVKGTFKAGLYVNQDTTNNRYSLVSNTFIDTHMDILGTYFNIVNGFAEVAATPKFDGESEDGRFDIKYNLTIMDKKVLDEVSTINGGYHSNRDFTFEKDFATSNTFVVVVPFYYNIGGRGTVGIKPAMDLEFMQKQIPSIMEVVKTTQVPNPAPRPEGEILDVSGLEKIDFSSHMHYYPYEDLPQWAKTFVDSIGLEKSVITGEEANVLYVMDPNSKLQEEYDNRVRHNNIINDYKEYVSQIVTENVILDKNAVGANIKFTAQPFVKLSGYAGGGFGVDQSFSMARFSLGVGASADLNPILDFVMEPQLDGFIGIGHSNATNKDYLLLNYGFKAPVTYEMLKGKAFVGAHVLMSVKVFNLWHDIINKDLGITLFEQMTPQKATIDVIQPINKTHGIELSL